MIPNLRLMKIITNLISLSDKTIELLRQVVDQLPNNVDALCKLNKVSNLYLDLEEVKDEYIAICSEPEVASLPKVDEQNFLEVMFHDNDFTMLLENALKRVYEYTIINNVNVSGDEKKPVVEIFKELHKAGSLKLIIERVWNLEVLLSDVEESIRGLNLNDTKYNANRWGESGRIATQAILKDSLSYLNATYKFHKGDRFTKEKSNGEHSWLNLETGETGSL